MEEVRQKIYTVEGNSPECPACGNWNALLEYGAPEIGTNERDLKCRDCGHVVRAGFYTIVDRYAEMKQKAGGLIDSEWEVLRGFTKQDLFGYLSGVIHGIPEHVSNDIFRQFAGSARTLG